MPDIHDFEPLWGAWMVDDFIGEGSYGKVYKAVREEFGRRYEAAVKLISIPQSQAEADSLRDEGMDAEAVRQYYDDLARDIVSEIHLMSQLRGSSNVVSYEDHFIQPKPDGVGYDILIRMELLTSLSQHLRNEAPTRRDVLQLGIGLCRALELCQRHHVIHRDVKPDNIFISPNGDFKLGDFGIARQIERTMSNLSKKGTYTYMAPEVYKGQPYNATVDIYSLGIVMYRLTNNNRVPLLPQPPAPVMHSDREQSLVRRMSGEALPPPVNAQGALGDAILKAAAYDPKARYDSPRAMREALEAILDDSADAPLAYPHGDISPSDRTGDNGTWLGSLFRRDGVIPSALPSAEDVQAPTPRKKPASRAQKRVLLGTALAVFAVLLVWAGSRLLPLNPLTATPTPTPAIAASTAVIIPTPSPMPPRLASKPREGVSAVKYRCYENIYAYNTPHLDAKITGYFPVTSTVYVGRVTSSWAQIAYGDGWVYARMHDADTTGPLLPVLPRLQSLAYYEANIPPYRAATPVFVYRQQEDASPYGYIPVGAMVYLAGDIVDGWGDVYISDVHSGDVNIVDGRQAYALIDYEGQLQPAAQPTAEPPAGG